MGRLSAILVALCMALIAASVAIACWLTLGFTGMEAAVLGVAVLTALVMVNSVTGRARDRSDVGNQIADLSRGTADIGRQVSELDRRMVALEGEIAAAMDRSRAVAEPLAAEIDELGGLVKELADAVAAHEQMLESAISNAASVHVAPAPALAPAPSPAGRGEDEEDESEDDEDNTPPRQPRTTGPLRGLEHAAVVAQIARAIEANRVDLFLQPIVTLPQRKVRYYEALTRLRTDDGTMLTPSDFLKPAESTGLIPAIDNMLVFRCVQVVRRLSTKNREVGVFCNISAATLTDASVFQEIIDFLGANRVLAPHIVFEFQQSAVRAMGPIEQASLATLADLGFGFSMDHLTDLRVEPRELADRGFRFIKVPAALLLSRAARERRHPSGRLLRSARALRHRPDRRADREREHGGGPARLRRALRAGLPVLTAAPDPHRGAAGPRRTAGGAAGARAGAAARGGAARRAPASSCRAPRHRARADRTRHRAPRPGVAAARPIV